MKLPLIITLAVAALHFKLSFSIRTDDRPIQLDDHSKSLNFLMHGDWGWNNFNQTLTAYEMGVYAWIIDAKFVIALGDNFYEVFFHHHRHN